MSRPLPALMAIHPGGPDVEEKTRGQVDHSDFETTVEMLIDLLDMSPKLREDMLVDHKQKNVKVMGAE